MKILRLSLAVMFVFIWGGIAWAAESDNAYKAEIKAFILKHRKAFQEKDIETVMTLYTDDAVLLGTSEGERFVGQEEIKNAYLEYFNTFDKEEYTLTWHKAKKMGDVVWVAGMTYIRAYYKNEKNEFPINWTAVLVKEDGAWKFAQRHISNLSCE